MSGGIGVKPELKWVKIDNLVIPTQYQRSTQSDASKKSINRIKQDWNWAECGALIVCMQKDSKPAQFAVIDGQHRYKAALLHGRIPELPCVVISERDIPEQAKNFMAINENRVNLHILHKYNAMIAAEDANAKALDAILKKCKVTVASNTFTDNLQPNVTVAVGTLLKMMTQHTEKQIIWSITVITEAFPTTGGVLTANLIRAMAMKISDDPQTDRAAMVSALASINMDKLKSDASAYRKIEGGTIVTAMIRVIEKKYNSAKRVALPGEAQAPSQGGA